MFMKNHSITFGGNVEKFHSDNSFYFGIQSAYSYATLDDFYADANGYLANPNRTVAAAPSRFQVKYLLQPGETTPPLQPLDVLYWGAYVQDQWRPKNNLTITAGLRVDMPVFGNTALRQPRRRHADLPRPGRQPGAVQHRQATRHDGLLVAARRLQLGRRQRPEDAGPRRNGRVLAASRPTSGSRTRSATPASSTASSTRARRLRPTRSTRAPTSTSRRRRAARRPATSSTSPTRASGSRRPGAATSAVDRKLFWGMTGAVDFMYNRDLNAPVYINANLPAARLGLHGRRHAAPLGGDSRRGTGLRDHARLRERAVRHQDQQPARQEHHSRVRDQEPERQPLVEHLGLAHQDAVARCLVQGRLQLRRIEEHGGTLVHGRQFVGVGRTRSSPTRTTRRWRSRRTRPASASSCRATTRCACSTGARRPSRCSTTAARTATPATSSRATPTVTPCRATT